ncbi:MAG TPA: FkbM family methyltransferase, partial [Verrucomicrobiae bacterium]
MKKLSILLGLFKATAPQHWPRLVWYIIAWVAHRLFKVDLWGEHPLIFRDFKALVSAKGRGGLVFLHEILANNIYDVPAIKTDKSIRTVFDAGANCGFFALRFASESPGSLIFCFEPHPETFQHLRKNIDANELVQRILPFNEAVGAGSGECTINVSAESSMSIVTSSSIQFLAAPKAVRVPMTSLDDFAGRQKLWPDYIKIDVEGFEV